MAERIIVRSGRAKTFYFRFKVRPSKSSKNYRDVKAAYANIWALGRGLGEARRVAMNYSTRQGWDFISLEQDGVETTLQRCPSPEARYGFSTAQAYGSYGIFVATGISAAGGDASFN